MSGTVRDGTGRDGTVLTYLAGKISKTGRDGTVK